MSGPLLELLLSLHTVSIIIMLVLTLGLLHPVNAIDTSDHGRVELLWSANNLVVIPSLMQDKNIKRAGNDNTKDNKEQRDVGASEAKDMEGIHAAHFVETRVGEGGDNGQNGGRDVSKHRSPKERNIPVLSLTDNEIEVPAELVGL